ncbi:hypothetical protein GOODEAATRI_007691 [Goodea atripinnis]|uniref:Uncharacterized protein n=1 Tax=Goodea atripinnis TaxID=208336 RepID=A0ABV0MQ48_9TELE
MQRYLRSSLSTFSSLNPESVSRRNTRFRYGAVEQVLGHRVHPGQQRAVARLVAAGVRQREGNSDLSVAATQHQSDKSDVPGRLRHLRQTQRSPWQPHASSTDAARMAGTIFKFVVTETRQQQNDNNQCVWERFSPYGDRGTIQFVLITDRVFLRRAPGHTGRLATVQAHMPQRSGFQSPALTYRRPKSFTPEHGRRNQMGFKRQHDPET